MRLVKQYAIKPGFVPEELWEDDRRFFFWTNDGFSVRPSQRDMLWEKKYPTVLEAELDRFGEAAQ